MSNKELSLFIFEGIKTEGLLIEKLEKNFLGDNHSIKCVYDAEIYQIYKKLKAEEDLFFDIVNLLKERSAVNRQILNDYTRDSFAYIYLFFDYDAHSTLANDDKLIEMLQFFNNETEHGLLYISYPMVEAIRHYKDLDSFRTLTFKCKGALCKYINECDDKEECLNSKHYKTFVPTDSRPALSNVNAFTIDVWKELITAHLYKMNDLVNGSYTFPNDISDQLLIFLNQLEKYINKKCPEVTVLSAFPLFILDYYGCNKLKEKLEISDKI